MLQPGPRERTLLLAMAALLALPSAGLAQAGPARPDGRTRTWVATGLGGGGSEDNAGVAVLVQVAVQKRAHLFLLRGVGTLDPSPDASEPMGDIGLLYGRVRSGPMGHAAIAAGPGLLVGGCAGQTNARCPVIPALPFLTEAALHLGPAVGLGAQLFANVNSRGFIYGAAVFLQLGWFPP